MIATMVVKSAAGYTFLFCLLRLLSQLGEDFDGTLRLGRHIGLLLTVNLELAESRVQRVHLDGVAVRILKRGRIVRLNRWFTEMIDGLLFVATQAIVGDLRLTKWRYLNLRLLAKRVVHCLGLGKKLGGMH